ncbi:unnamed protein product [Macrosiphum euphorbiae]|uniref:Uncharacterized protein n=1 Tax=Macrosiphum euphorbiae TaxID=13131 RepID=A0AAV0WIF0_9HEMI|nr:unnamed protein product [Macrosiphum euphorbiae]
MVIVLPGLFMIQESPAELKYFLNGPNTVLSRGCNLCEQWGGKDSIMMPLFFAKLRSSILKCDPWSNNNNTGRSVVLFTWLWKRLRNKIKSSSCIKPEGLAEPLEPGGPFARK